MASVYHGWSPAEWLTVAPSHLFHAALDGLGAVNARAAMLSGAAKPDDAQSTIDAYLQPAATRPEPQFTPAEEAEIEARERDLIALGLRGEL